MPHSHSCCLVHVVFATAERRSTIDDAMRARLFQYMGGIAREHALPALAIGGTANHVHVLISLPRTISVAKAVQVLKGCSSKWIHENFPNKRGFAWQEGYGAFSIGISQKGTTMNYIETQMAHHQRYSFAEEMEKFIAVHAMVGDTKPSSPERTEENSQGRQSWVPSAPQSSPERDDRK